MLNHALTGCLFSFGFRNTVMQVSVRHKRSKKSHFRLRPKLNWLNPTLLPPPIFLFSHVTSSLVSTQNPATLSWNQNLWLGSALLPQIGERRKVWFSGTMRVPVWMCLIISQPLDLGKIKMNMLWQEKKRRRRRRWRKKAECKGVAVLKREIRRRWKHSSLGLSVFWGTLVVLMAQSKDEWTWCVHKTMNRS